MKIVYLTEEENNKYSKLSNSYGVFSRMARTALPYLESYSLVKKIKVCNEHSLLLKEKNRQMAAIGNNLNQIAHQINLFVLNGQLPKSCITGSAIPLIEEVKLLIGEMYRLEEKLRTRLYSMDDGFE